MQGGINSKSYDVNHVSWPNREAIENRLKSMNANYLQEFPDDVPPVKAAAYEALDKKSESGALKGLNTFLGRNLLGIADQVAHAFQIKADDEENVAQLECVDENYRHAKIEHHEEGLTLTISYYASKEQGEENAYRWLQPKDDQLSYIEIPKKEKKISKKKRKQSLLIDDVDLDQYDPLLTVTLQFKPRFEKHQDTDYLHALDLMGIRTDAVTGLIPRSVEKTTVNQVNKNTSTGWFGFGRQTQVSTPVENTPDENTVFKEFRDQNTHNEQVIAGQANDLRELTDKLEHEYAEVKILKNHNAAVQAELADSVTKIEKLTAGLESQKSELTQLNTAFEEQSKQVESLAAEVNTLSSENAALQEQLKKLQAENLKLQDEKIDAIKQRNAANDALRGHLEQLKEEHQQHVETLRSLHATEISKINELNQQKLDQKDGEIKEVRGQVTKLSHALNELNMRFASFIGAAESALQNIHAQHAQTFNRLQSVLNRTALYDLYHAMTKPFIWGWHKIRKHQPGKAAELGNFQAPECLEQAKMGLQATMSPSAEFKASLNIAEDALNASNSNGVSILPAFDDEVAQQRVSQAAKPTVEGANQQSKKSKKRAVL